MGRKQIECNQERERPNILHHRHHRPVVDTLGDEGDRKHCKNPRNGARDRQEVRLEGIESEEMVSIGYRAPEIRECGPKIAQTQSKIRRGWGRGDTKQESNDVQRPKIVVAHCRPEAFGGEAFTVVHVTLYGG